MELKLTQSSLPTAIFSSSSFFPKHFALLAQKWKLDIQRISWKGQDLSKKIVVHVVKEGETLCSISKLHGVPMLEIAAANKEIPDADLVSQGQLLNIPCAVAGYPQLWHFEGKKLNEHQLPPDLGFFHGREWTQILTIPLSRHPPLAKTTASVLLLLPLIAFCIGCIMGTFPNIVTRNLRHQAAKKSKLHHRRSNGVRWKTALSELRDPESLVAEPEPELDSDPLAEDHDQLQFEDMSHDYTQLEGEYHKFLKECGMSEWGHWRGGSPQ